MAGGGTWSTAKLPLRAGPYINFVAALAAAVDPGIEGTAVVVGTADWGPIDQIVTLRSQGEFDASFSASAGGTLRQGVLGAFEGAGPLGGASTVLAVRTTATGSAAATLVLSDATTAALTLTAKYHGSRANNFHATVRTNGANKDVILYESGVEIQRFENVVGTNTAVAALINAGSDYATAVATGAADRVLNNIVGVIGGAGGFGVAGGGVAGNSGPTLVVQDITDVLALLREQQFAVILIAELVDDALRDIFAAWVKDLNATGRRFFGAVGGPAAEPLTGGAVGAGASAAARSVEYDSRDILNVGATDLRRLSDGAVLSTARLAARVAGAQAGIGVKRALTGLRFEGYQVNNPLSAKAYEDSIGLGVITFANEGPRAVVIEQGVTSMVTSNSADRPAGQKKVRNVATDHFLQNTLQETYRRYVGDASNTQEGRVTIAADTLEFLKDAEEQRLIALGESSVELDSRYVQGGNAMFMKTEYAYYDTIERIFLSIRVSQA